MDQIVKQDGTSTGSDGEVSDILPDNHRQPSDVSLCDLLVNLDVEESSGDILNTAEDPDPTILHNSQSDIADGLTHEEEKSQEIVRGLTIVCPTSTLTKTRPSE